MEECVAASTVEITTMTVGVAAVSPVVQDLPDVTLAVDDHMDTSSDSVLLQDLEQDNLEGLNVVSIAAAAAKATVYHCITTPVIFYKSSSTTAGMASQKR